MAATRRPIRPKPTIPIVNPASSIGGAFQKQKSGLVAHSPACTATLAADNAGVAQNVTLNRAGNDFASVGVTKGKDVALTDKSAIDLGASMISGKLERYELHGHPFVTQRSVEEYAKAAREAGATAHQGGTYICMEGPAFSTRAESNMYRMFGVSVIGMTNIPEAKLAREAEICYGVIALATDYDCWHQSHEDVSVDAILAIIQQNVTMAKAIIKNAVCYVGSERKCSCQSALRYAIITDKAAISEQSKEDLDIIIGKYL